jgi:hypothetical protein
MTSPVLEPLDIRVRLTITGKSPLVMHNAQLADPDCEFTQQIKEITQKRQGMTPEDRQRKGLLEWRGCLYTEEVKEEGDAALRERVVVPTINLRRAMEDGGKAFKRGGGLLVERGVLMAETYAVLEYDGPRDINDLMADPRFRFRTMVNGNPSRGKGSKVPRTRAIFPAWSLTTTLVLMTEQLGWEDFDQIIRITGRSVGICDAKKLGNGRFSVAKLRKL